MAIIRPGHVVGAISGNLGSCNYVQGKYGPYVRTRLTRADKLSARQLETRARFARVKNMWRELTDEQRLTWNVAGANIRYVNRLGLARPVRGHTVFFRLNMMIEPWGEPYYTTPPVLKTTDPYRDVVFTINLPNVYRVEFWTEYLPALFRVQIATARPLSGAPVRPVKHWRLTLTNSSQSYPVNFKSEFLAQWGEPQVGEYVYLLIRGWSFLRTPAHWVEAGCIVN